MWMVVLASLLSGCAAPASLEEPSRHVAPTGLPTARFVMRGDVSPGDRYGMYIFDDSENCAGPRSLGIGGKDRHPATTAVATNVVQTVEFTVVKPSRQYCAVRLSFEPVAGRSYLFAGASSAEGCSARLMDMSNPDDMKPEPSVRRRNPGTSACLSLAASRRGAGAGSAAVSSDAVLRPGANDDDLKGLIRP